MATQPGLRDQRRPLVETTGIVAGFYVIEAPDLDAPLAIAGTNRVIQAGGGVEVRPVHSGGRG